jgi:hypothetical protein
MRQERELVNYAPECIGRRTARTVSQRIPRYPTGQDRNESLIAGNRVSAR